MGVNIQISNLGKTYNQPLFVGVNLQAISTNKIGLIGDNGSGKSTFLKILANLDTADTGQALWSKNAKIGYLEQEIISETFSASGGEKKILKLAELFYSDYNVLLLDEPDNHLDLDHKIWFRQLVTDFTGIIIVTSHDRDFLENSVDTIWNLADKNILQYNGSYSKFKQVYEDIRESKTKLWETQEKERLRLLDAVHRFRDSAKANSKLAGRYRGMVKRYEKWVAEMETKPSNAKILNLELNLAKQHHRKTAILIKDLEKAYSKLPILSKINLHLFCGEKVAILAPNGSGKSTLLNILAGKLKQDSGLVRIGEGLKIGYYAQEHLEALDENLTLIDELQKTVPIEHFDAIAYLKRFLFNENLIKGQVKNLSGGQKSRLQLAKFLATNPDILILDEPTNHLDLKSVLALESFLKSYRGTLVLVSHDQKLVDCVVEKKLELVKGNLQLIS